MPLGEVLYDPGSTLSHVYFRTTAIASFLYVMQNGDPRGSLWLAMKEWLAFPS